MQISTMIWTFASFSVDDYLDICKMGSCKKNNNVVTLVASLSALIIIILISVGFWRYKRQPGTL